MEGYQNNHPELEMLSGFDFFTQVVMGPEQIKDGPQAQGINLADVMFLTQPMCDDLNQA